MDTVNPQGNALATRDIPKRKKILTQVVRQFVKVNVERIQLVWHPINVTAARTMFNLTMDADFEWKCIRY